MKKETENKQKKMTVEEVITKKYGDTLYTHTGKPIPTNHLIWDIDLELWKEREGENHTYKDWI